MVLMELPALTVQDVREVRFDVFRDGVEVLKRIVVVLGFGPTNETLTMLKPIHGLPGAPGAWMTTWHHL